MKSLAQIGYEAFTTATGVDAVPWSQVVDANPRRGSPLAKGAWGAVAAAIERAVVERLRAEHDRAQLAACETMTCGACGAHLMKGESHGCAENRIARGLA